MNKKNIFIVISLVFGLALFTNSLLAQGIESIYETLKNFSFLKFLLIVAIGYGNFALYTLRWKIIIKALEPKSKISFEKIFHNRISGFAFSYITPSALIGGEPLRVIFLEDEGISRKNAISSTIIDKALELTAFAVFVSSGLLVAAFTGNLPFGSNAIIFGLVGFVALMIFWFYYCSLKKIGFVNSIFRVLHLKKIKRLEKVAVSVKKFEDEMNGFYFDHRGEMVKLIVLSVVTTSMMLLEHYIVARFMGVNLNFMQLFLVSSIPYFSYIVPVPGGLGILESTHTTIFGLLGVQINAFAFVLILRLRDLVMVASGIFHTSKSGFKMIKKDLEGKNKKLS